MMPTATAATAPGTTPATLTLGPRYRPSGRFDPVVLLVLILPAAAIALAMAFVLRLAESGGWYLYFLTPLGLALPVVGAVYLALRAGRCRNVLLGAALGPALLALYYVGYWQLSYQRFLSGVDRELAEEALREETGLGGLPGYFIFHCRHTKPESVPGRGGGSSRKDRGPDRGDEIFNYVFFGAEAAILVGVGVALGLFVSTRVYYERAGRWASQLQRHFRIEDAPAAAAAIRAGRFADLAALPAVALDFSAKRQAAVATFTAEYLAGAPEQAADAPVFVSLKLNNASGGKALVRDLGGSGRHLVRQAELPAPWADAFRAAFTPELAAPVSGGPAAPPAAPVAMPVWKPGFIGSLQRAGAWPVEMSGPDFRGPAAAASLALLRSRGIDPARAADPAAASSLCLYVDPDGPAKVRAAALTRLKLELSGFGCLIAGIAALAVGFINTGASNPDFSAWPGMLILTGGALVLAALSIFITRWWLFGGPRRGRLIRELAVRPGALFGPDRSREATYVRVEHQRTFHLPRLAADDHAVLLPDAAHRRLLIEGVCCRYVIRAEDVSTLRAVASGHKVAVEVTYAAAGAELPLVIETSDAAVNAQKSGPKLEARLRDALGLPPSLMVELPKRGK